MQIIEDNLSKLEKLQEEIDMWTNWARKTGLRVKELPNMLDEKRVLVAETQALIDKHRPATVL